MAKFTQSLGLIAMPLSLVDRTSIKDVQKRANRADRCNTQLCLPLVQLSLHICIKLIVTPSQKRNLPNVYSARSAARMSSDNVDFCIAFNSSLLSSSMWTKRLNCACSGLSCTHPSTWLSLAHVNAHMDAYSQKHNKHLPKHDQF